TGRIQVSRQIINGTCGTFRVITTWTVSDSCGHTVSARQTITLQTPSPPSFNNLPGNMTVPCDAIPPVATVTGQTPCTFVNISFSTYNVSGSCPNDYFIYRVWTLHHRDG